MNKGEITIGWKDLFEKIPQKPEGYNTASEIAEKIGISPRTTRKKLKRSREAGKIKAQKCIIDNHVMWVYKQ